MQPDFTTSPWATPLDPQGGPLYLQIVERLEHAIAAGTLRAGDRLSAQRAVASRLGVDLTTVTRAYAQARTRGLVIADGPRGTFVAAQKVELRALVDLSLNIPPQPADPDLHELLRHGLAQVLLRADIDLLMTYHLAGGSAADRAAGARWLRPMLGDVDPGRVVASPGAQSALSALILALTRPGEVLLCEPLVYPGFRAAASQLGRLVQDVGIDDEGMLPAALEEAVRRSGARVVYLNPTIQNPTTVTMPEGRRRALAATAARLDLQVIEDDPYWLLADAAPPPLARLAPERVHYVATLSKCLSPGLRTAFVVSPDATRQSAFLAALRSFSLMRAPLTAVLVTQWLQDGTALRILAGVRAEARAPGGRGTKPGRQPRAGARVARGHPPVAGPAQLLDRPGVRARGARARPGDHAVGRVLQRHDAGQRDPDLAGRRTRPQALVARAGAAVGPAGASAIAGRGRGDLMPRPGHRRRSALPNRVPAPARGTRRRR